MKVLIITLHSILNPGSALQAFALNKYLNLEGFDSRIIDYRPFYSRIGKHKIKGIIRNVLFLHSFLSESKVYDTFIKKEIPTTRKTYFSYNAIKSAIPEADIYITGSDQLWNMDYDCGNDRAYYLSFVKSGKKISYSTSVGKENIKQEELDSICKKIESYDYISVREESTSRMLSKALHREVTWVCDPVFLLPLENYLCFIGNNNYGKYALVYLSEHSTELDGTIEYIRKTHNLKIIQIGGPSKRCDCDFLIKETNPYVFLTMIYNAEIVVSSSFHATAFSLIFDKNFAVIEPKGNGERLISILSCVDLMNKVIRRNCDLDNVFKVPNYSFVHDRLNKYIGESKKYLREALSSEKIK